MFSESDAAAIRAVFSEEGELSAGIELRQRFRGPGRTVICGEQPARVRRMEAGLADLHARRSLRSRLR